MIEVSGLTKRYGEITALNDVTFNVAKGQIVGFLGANGAGKTTTMDILCGCIGADNGTAKISGIEITENPEDAKRKLGYLPDEPPLYNDMQVKEFVAYAGRLHGLKGAELKGRIDEVMQRLSLGEVANRLVGNLSKGFRQRVGLAQAIVHDPEVLVLDEPTEGLDPNQIVQIRELIKSLAGKHTILLSSHILSEVQNTCDHIIIIHQGKVVQQGTYEELVSKASGGGYRLQVTRDSDRLISELKKLSGLTDVKVMAADAGKIEFHLQAQKSTLDDVARVVVNGNYGLKEIVSNTKSLEEVFFQFTH